LIWSFVHGARQNEIQLIDAVPSRCSQLLGEHEVQGALIPVIEYQRIDGLRIVNNICVGSFERVRSVMLASQKKNLRDVRTVALDESSRTSATLLKIIFREFLDTDPRWTASEPNLPRMLSENDAALIIGDPGMTFDREGLHVFDMASLWREYTGKGFVFAMWALREDASDQTRMIDFQSACDEGKARLSEIVDLYHRQLGLPSEELFTYLTENITFRLDEGLRAGLDLYYRLANKHDLIPRVKPLEFVNS
jgi:chorismate dehydratase